MSGSHKSEEKKKVGGDGSKSTGVSKGPNTIADVNPAAANSIKESTAANLIPNDKKSAQ